MERHENVIRASRLVEFVMAEAPCEVFVYITGYGDYVQVAEEALKGTRCSLFSHDTSWVFQRVKQKSRGKYLYLYPIL